MHKQHLREVLLQSPHIPLQFFQLRHHRNSLVDGTLQLIRRDSPAPQIRGGVADYGLYLYFYCRDYVEVVSTQFISEHDESKLYSLLPTVGPFHVGRLEIKGAQFFSAVRTGDRLISNQSMANQTRTNVCLLLSVGPFRNLCAQSSMEYTAVALSR